MTVSNYRVIEEYDDGALIELDRFCAFDWVYLAADGSVDIGKVGERVMHTVRKFQAFGKGNLGPDKIRIRVMIEPATHPPVTPRGKEADRWRKVGDLNEKDS